MLDIRQYVEDGKIIIFSFWVIWCFFCKKEFDVIVDFYGFWQEEYDVEFVVIIIDIQWALVKVKLMVEVKGWIYIIFFDLNQ